MVLWFLLEVHPATNTNRYEASSMREARKSHSTESRAKGDAPAEQQHGSEHLGS